MKDHNGDFLGFYHSAESWHWPASRTRDERDSVNFGFYAPEGGTSGEMVMLWSELGGKLVPCLRVYDDAWSTLAHLSELVMAMGEIDDQNVSPAAFCAMLLDFGFKDLTQRVRSGDEPRMDLLMQLRSVAWSEMPTDVLERVVDAIGSR